jgi:hypothetical protein
LLALFGIIVLPSGLMLWNGLGKHFGLSGQPNPIDKRAAWETAAAAVLLIVLELVLAQS